MHINQHVVVSDQKTCSSNKEFDLGHMHATDGLSSKYVYSAVQTVLTDDFGNAERPEQCDHCE